MNNSSNSRLSIAVTLGILYLLPLVVLSSYITSLLPVSERWNILSVGLLTTAVGTTILFLMLQRWERGVREQMFAALPHAYASDEDFSPSPHFEPPSKSSETLTVEACGKEIQRLTDLLKTNEDSHGILEMQHKEEQQLRQALAQENAQLQEKVQRLEFSFSTLKQNSEMQVQEKENALQDVLQTNADQRNTLEKRQKQIQALENTVRDLKYELKTLLDLTDRIHTPEPGIADIVPVETPETPPQRQERSNEPLAPVGRAEATSQDSIQQLKRCVDIAQKFTGARHLAEQPSRFQDLSVDGYALDLRRLCDSLRSEMNSTIVLYSQKDEKLLFANNEVRNLLGWSAEKFVQDFPNLVTEGWEDWKKAVKKAPFTNPCDVSLLVKTRDGDNKLLRCQLGVVPTGIFKTHLIGIIQAG